MASSAANSCRNESFLSSIRKSVFKPVNRENFLFYYLPLNGAVSHSLLAVNVMNPGLVMRVFPKQDFTNLLLFNTMVGTGLYMYGKRHVKAAPQKLRVTYSIFGAMMFSFGSVLFWAILRSFLPRNVTLCTCIGVGSGVTLLKVGKDYLNFVDRQTVED